MIAKILYMPGKPKHSDAFSWVLKDTNVYQRLSKITNSYFILPFFSI